MKRLFLRVDSGSLEKGPLSNSPFDLYVHLPTQQKYIRWIKKGDAIEERKFKALLSHPDPHFYRLNDDSLSQESPLIVTQEHLKAHAEGKLVTFEGSPQKGGSGIEVIASQNKDREAAEAVKVVASTNLKKEAPAKKEKSPISFETHFSEQDETFLKEPIREQLLSLYNRMMDPRDEKLLEDTQYMEQVTDKLLTIIAPNVANLKSHLIKNSKYVHIIHDTASIISLAILFAAADGHTSRNVFRDLSYSCILMDLSLMNISKQDLNLYYKDRSLVSQEIQDKILDHPKVSLKMALNKIKTLSDLAQQLIIGHHELYNGQGYPKKARSDLLAPLVRTLALAVDCFEIMKQSYLNNEPQNLEQVLTYLRDEPVEPHLRRHGRKITQDTLRFVMSNEAIIPPQEKGHEKGTKT